MSPPPSEFGRKGEGKGKEEKKGKKKILSPPSENPGYAPACTVYKSLTNCLKISYNEQLTQD